ncbi:hypothetical protein FHQ26_00740 [Testudinibacter sp. TR-2022]|uniref:DUF5358 domain-containing protein n=1 Tax=Testudinibacter sp. TR-2022 TaxID=2585029 RepID=UPI00111ACCEA|nr:DUF5358 domain-containing protein [Testudinibacter sp. TR-2022]TNH04748.1 hypothetical protein FHQ22_03265 [Pasteurellaceae bacterium Phil31]TNH08648.1 hypothetical protein FHQ25_09320 [Testudinibacter sp. TR-2022]TNH12940.1 hypothetical protein FHQ26_00740 [Testudinibacter sp. TR-2022]TNH13413.1 hypothetical protein FIA56_07435 [Testudinibacter sp. TR-2022]TNH16976.1 hypothetical protein FHQ23_08040 [Testudinibacter sp. TR-2022]
MLKKLVLPAIALSVVACSLDKPEAAFPAEFANADYILSDTDAKRWVMSSHQTEQCVYPNLTRIQQAHFSQEDAYIHSQYVFFYPLEKIIGADYLKMVQEDEKSMGYAQYQYKKFKQVSTEPLPKAQCELLRANARDDLSVVKGQYKSGMVEESKTDSKQNGDAVATGDNKFFFDIIKWGAALVL